MSGQKSEVRSQESGVRILNSGFCFLNFFSQITLLTGMVAGGLSAQAPGNFPNRGTGVPPVAINDQTGGTPVPL